MCKLKISKPSGETSGGRSDKPRRMGVSGKGDAGRASNVWQSDGEPGDVGAPSPTPQQHQQATTRASAPLLEQVEMMPHSPVRPTGAKQKRKTTDKGDQAPMPRSGESCRKVMEEGGNFVSIGGSKKSIKFLRHLRDSLYTVTLALRSLRR